MSLQGSLLYEKEDSVRDWLNRLTRGSHALAVDPRKGKNFQKRKAKPKEKKCENQKNEKLEGERGGGGPPKLESSMATYEMLSSFATGFFVLARQAAYMSHIENGFEQN